MYQKIQKIITDYAEPKLGFSSEKEKLFEKYESKKLRPDFYNSFTYFHKYQILDGERPDQVAKKLYDSSKLDWVVLITAGITNVRNQWPLSDKDIYEYALGVYGTEINSTRFYETIEVKD